MIQPHSTITAPIQPNHFNIHLKLDQFCEEDLSLKKELTHLYRKSFIDFQMSFGNFLANKDYEAFRFLNHKLYSSFELLELHELKKTMSEAMEWFKDGNFDPAVQKELCQRVEKMCRQIIFELDHIAQ
ncbi:hypothetical protein [Persicobacter sp. CCB-QB2]|uniref:hypothetical protein n=1 Tax=Persicobacter sp. CCB-QB2 TaxID=1561025 RepID=UPI0006A9DA3C|nr:hypothetical protein [Persicobacter sp. CCB-QB2]